jgi:hypothetical protein
VDRVEGGSVAIGCHDGPAQGVEFGAGLAGQWHPGQRLREHQKPWGIGYLGLDGTLHNLLTPLSWAMPANDAQPAPFADAAQAAPWFLLPSCPTVLDALLTGGAQVGDAGVLILDLGEELDVPAGRAIALRGNHLGQHQGSFDACNRHP